MERQNMVTKIAIAVISLGITSVSSGNVSLIEYESHVESTTAVTLTDNPLPSASRRNFIRADEQVVLRMLTRDQMAKKYGITLPNANESLKSLVAGADFLSFGVGLVVDFIQAQLSREAAKHTQQFKMFTYADDFWVDGIPKYAGFEMVRYAKGFDGKNDTNPAFQYACYFEPSEHDPRIFLMRAVYLKVDASKAKVSTSGGKRNLTVQINTVMEAAEFNSKNVFSKVVIANDVFTFPGYNLDTSNELKSFWNGSEWKGDLSNHIAGYFRAPHWNSKQYGGAFKLFVQVTETDESRVQDVLNKVEGFIGSNKDKIVEVVSP
ncbi:MAG: hypothetical protein P1U42_11680 [Phycisphaerales bacterium]|nr:hypothetical protein [Phycisphaerales bacterium]